MRNNNGKTVQKLSLRSLRNNRMRNLFAIFAIILTSMLFTAVFSLFSGMIQVSQESTMHAVGSRFHAGLKAATMEQYEKTTKDPLIKYSSYNIFIGYAKNILKRQTEIRYLPSQEDLSNYFITLQKGKLPSKENEIVIDTFIMDELNISYTIGEKVPLVFEFLGKKIEKEFIVSGYYQGDSINHASTIFISESFWLKLKGKQTDDDFKTWSKKHPEDSGIGLLSVNLFFDNASHIEEKVQTVITNAGYQPETELDYGVNWAYMKNRLQSIDLFSVFIVFGALFIILLTGYLIIYNIFQISVINDIRFYGLLKTIGTTKKQLHSLIMRQILLLSIIGIPIGLFLGYIIGNIGLPIITSFMNYENMEISLAFNPNIFLFGAIFSTVTVFLSCKKPGKIAGSVSPIEAVKYTEQGYSYKKKQKKHRPFHLISMALSNLERNKKKTSVVIAALSLSMILLILIATGINSFSLEQFLEQRIAGDIMIGSNNIFNSTAKNGQYELDKEYIALAKSQKGIEEENELWVGFSKQIRLDKKGIEQLQRLNKEEKLRYDEYTKYSLKEALKGDGLLFGDIFGYTDGLLKNLKVLEGTLNISEFQNGNYILLTRFYGKETLDINDSLYHPGDKVIVSTITKDSKSNEITDKSGNTLGISYDNRSEKEYTVMAIIELPASISLHRYSPNSMQAVLPLKEFYNKNEINNTCFAHSYQIKENEKENFEKAIKNYTETVNSFMGYASKMSLEKEFKGMINAMAIIGMVLAGVIALIGVLNFINAIFTGIISRKREFAMLQSIGMTVKQLKSMIVLEGISYILIASIFSLCTGSLLAYILLNALNHIILFFKYQFEILSFFIITPILIIIAIIAPILSFRQLQKHSIVERLRETE